MKSNKLAFAASVAVLALWASNGKAQLLNRFETLNFSLVAMQQEIDDSGPSGPYGNVLLPNIETSKITSKDLLKYLATALNTNWPAGAQLALGEIEVPSGQGYGPAFIQDIFVVDKTGTNTVFDVSTGMNVGDTNVVYFGYDSDGTVFSIKGVSLEKTKEVLRVSAETQFGKIFFHLFDEQNGITNMDLYFDGLNTIKVHSKMITTTNKITEHGTTSEQAPVTGDGTFNGEWTVVKGKVTGSEKWELYGIAGPSIPPTNRPSPIINTNIIPPFTNWLPPIRRFTNIFRITNVPPPVSPPGFHPTTNPPPPIILNP
jgi:hypothetical protein